MENIIVVETQESAEDKLSKYKITGDPESFIKLEAAYIQNEIKYAFANSIDKLLREVLETDVYAVSGDYVINPGVPIYFKYDDAAVISVKKVDPNSAAKNGVNKESPFLYQNQQIGVSLLFTRERPAQIGEFEDIITRRFLYKPAQYRLAILITPPDLYSRIYYTVDSSRWIYQILSQPLRNDAVNIYKTKSQEFPFSDFTTNYKYISKLFNISPCACLIFINYSRTSFINIMLGLKAEEFVNYYESLREINVTEQLLEYDHVWLSVCGWISRELKLPLTNSISAPFTAVEKNIIQKRKNIIMNKFLATPCIHMDHYALTDLKLNGDFYECSHGNRIMCRHVTRERMSTEQIKEFFEEFGETIDNDVIICKICGAELLKNSDSDLMGDVSIANIGYDDELRKYLYKKCMIMMGQVDFKVIVSPEFIYHMANNILKNVYSMITTYFDKLDKIKGIPDDIIIAMKEIVANIYIYCAIVITSYDNMSVFGVREITNAKSSRIDARVIDRIANRLSRLLHTPIERTKNFKALNIINVVQGVIQEINKRGKNYVPREFTKNDIKRTTLYLYFKLFMDVSHYPKLESIPSVEEAYVDEINKLFRTILLSDKFIGEPIVQESGKTLYVYNKAFLTYIEESKALLKMEREYNRTHVHMYWHNQCASNEVNYVAGELTWTDESRPAVYIIDDGYIGYTWGTKGSIHHHEFTAANVGNKHYLLSELSYDQSAGTLYCSICGETGRYKDVGKEITQQLIIESKYMYFSNYCPKKINHEFKNNVCVYCGFIQTADVHKNIKFYEHHHLPVTVQNIIHSIKINPVLRKEFKPMKSVEAKYYGSLPKESYRNFWNNLCTYEDVTFKDLLNGKRGDETLGLMKLTSQIIWFNNIISRIVNIVNLPNKYLQPYAGHEMVLRPIIAHLYQVINSPYKYTYDDLRIIFIEAFNQLPTNIAEMILRDLLHNTELGSMSEEKVKVEALIYYKTKELDEQIDIDKGGEKGNLFSYEEFDYDGHNEEE